MGRASLLPGDGEALLDVLDENAHKHAFAVSEDLKYALREAIELLGNEATRQWVTLAREQKKGIYSGECELDERHLTRECLRLMYRLLFLFYIEARPELGQRIPHTQYAQELQRTRMFIAARNVFGVDLNPVAVELAEVSLWLNALSGSSQAPWFGYQLFCGNSLVGVWALLDRLAKGTVR